MAGLPAEKIVQKRQNRAVERAFAALKREAAGMMTR
jgi:hypothetical protein